MVCSHCKLPGHNFRGCPTITEEEKQKKIQEMTERNNKRDQEIKNRKHGFGSLPPLSPEQIARARQEWGITS